MKFQTSSSSHRSMGFTLVEMLIVLVVIGILAALIFPLFGRARESAQRMNCASNLKQVGLAIQMYVNDNRFYPSISPPGLNCAWADRIQCYVKSTQIFKCPAFEFGEYKTGCPAPVIEGNKIIQFRGSYDLNSLTYKGGQLHETHLKHPTSTILALDGQGAFVNPGLDPITDTQDLKLRGVQNRHNQGNNVLFADGHVKWLSLEAMTDRSLWLARTNVG